MGAFLRHQFPPSFLRRQESSHYRLLRVSAIKLVGNNYGWIPACAGMTEFGAKKMQINVDIGYFWRIMPRSMSSRKTAVHLCAAAAVLAFALGARGDDAAKLTENQGLPPPPQNLC